MAVVHPLLCCVTVLLCYCVTVLLCCEWSWCTHYMASAQHGMGGEWLAQILSSSLLAFKNKDKISSGCTLSELHSLPPPKLLAHSTPRVWMLVSNNFNSPIEQFPLILHFMVDSVKKTQMGVRHLMMAIAVMSSDPLHQIDKEMARNEEWKN